LGLEHHERRAWVEQIAEINRQLNGDTGTTSIPY
jgi:hypothetical protein